jgi:hypothetical protein
MKTLTEFSGFVLKEVMAKKAALLSEGKTEDEAQAQINEQLKLDESKSTFYKNVVDMTSSRMDRVKRVVVAVRATETEKVPETYIEREGHFYLVEYFPDANARGRSAGRDDERSFGRDRKGGRGNSRGGGRDGGGRDQGRGGGSSWGGDRNSSDRSSSDSRFPTRPATTATGTFAQKREGDPGNSPARAPRPPRAERKPRPAGERPARAPRAPRAAQGPKGAGELRLVLKGQSQTMLAVSAPVVSADTATAAPTPETN